MLSDHENSKLILYFCCISRNLFGCNRLQTAIRADVGKNKALIYYGGSFNAAKKIAII